MRLPFLLAAIPVAFAGCARGAIPGAVPSSLTAPSSAAAPVGRHFVVTSSKDAGPGSLRQKLAQARDGDRITFALPDPSTILLNGRRLRVAAGVTITGPGPRRLTIDAAHRSGIFLIATGRAVEIDRMTLQNGKAGYGGAIRANRGTLTVSHAIFSDNAAIVGGGGISSNGSVTVRTSRFAGNSAGGASARRAFGAAIFSLGNRLEITASRFQSNTVLAPRGYAYGGAIYCSGTTHLRGDRFDANGIAAQSAYGGALFGAIVAGSGNRFTSNGVAGTVTASGGAVYAQGPATFQGDVFRKNSASASGAQHYASGGAMALQVGGDTLDGVWLYDNLAQGPFANGGAIWIGSFTSPTARVLRSTIRNNRATSTTAASTATNYSGGGAVYNGGSLLLDASALFHNKAASFASGGALYNGGTARVVNSTLTNNSSATNGGGIEAAAGMITSVNATLYRNTAKRSGGNLAIAYGSSARVADTILAGGSAPVGEDVSNAGALTSLDYNVLQTIVSGNAMRGSTRYNLMTDPLLLLLAHNGGPTKTDAETAPSPSRNLIPLSRCFQLGVRTDQRGDPRGAGGNTRCDAGAYQWP